MNLNSISSLLYLVCLIKKLKFFKIKNVINEKIITVIFIIKHSVYKWCGMNDQKFLFFLFSKVNFNIFRSNYFLIKMKTKNWNTFDFDIKHKQQQQ